MHPADAVHGGGQRSEPIAASLRATQPARPAAQNPIDFDALRGAAGVGPEPGSDLGATTAAALSCTGSEACLVYVRGDSLTLVE